MNLHQLEKELKEIEQDITTTKSMSNHTQSILMEWLEARKMEIEAKIMEIILRINS